MADPTQWLAEYKHDDPIYEEYLERARTGKLHGYEIARLSRGRHPAKGGELRPGHTRGPEWEDLKKEARKRKFWRTLGHMYDIEASIPPQLPMFPGTTPPGFGPSSIFPGPTPFGGEVPESIARALEMLERTFPSIMGAPTPPTAPPEGQELQRRLMGTPLPTTPQLPFGGEPPPAIRTALEMMGRTFPGPAPRPERAPLPMPGEAPPEIFAPWLTPGPRPPETGAVPPPEFLAPWLTPAERPREVEPKPRERPPGAYPGVYPTLAPPARGEERVRESMRRLSG